MGRKTSLIPCLAHFLGEETDCFINPVTSYLHGDFVISSHVHQNAEYKTGQDVDVLKKTDFTRF